MLLVLLSRAISRVRSHIAREVNLRTLGLAHLSEVDAFLGCSVRARAFDRRE